MQRVAVIGGGLSGLAVAFKRLGRGDRVTLFEANGSPGGQLRTRLEDGYVVEEGAEGFVASSEAVPALAEAVGCRERIVGQLTDRSFGFDGVRLHPLLPGEAARFLGFQVPAAELGRGIRAFAGGMGELVECLVGALGGATLRFGTPVSAVEPVRGSIAVHLASGSSESFDAVVIATGARAAAKLLEPIDATAALLSGAPVVSSVTVALAYERTQVSHPLDGTGFVVAEEAQRGGLRACTFASSKLPGRAPRERALLRAFYRPNDDELDRLDDNAWSSRTADALAAILGITGAPEHVWVSRWPHALPVQDPKHRENVALVERALTPHRIVLSGSAFHGSGIDAALRSADRVSSELG